MSNLLLDTNAYSRLLKGDEMVRKAIDLSETIYLSVFVIGELLSGFSGGNREVENKEILFRFIRKPSVTVLQSSLETAEHYATVKNSLKKAGTPIPANDIWIAAHTIESGSTLMTFDKHFDKISHLKIWKG